MNRILITTVVAALSLPLALPAGDMFPLEFGNTWTYRETATGQQFTVRVGTPALIGERIYYTLTGYAASNVLARMNGEGQLVYLDPEFDMERVLTPLTPFEGGWWEAPYRECQQEAQAQERRGRHEGPAGTFAGTLDVRYRSFSCADAGTQLEQFADNIGMVRRVAGSFAGPRQFDLIYARVGRQIIETRPFGRFTVSAASSQDPGSVDITLQLQTASGPSIKLPFPSGQEFEIVIRNADGRTVWTWSDGKFFDQAFHEWTVSGEWRITVPAPLPLSIGSSDYTISAWLTTAPDSPRFSATTAVTLGGPAR